MAKHQPSSRGQNPPASSNLQPAPPDVEGAAPQVEHQHRLPIGPAPNPVRQRRRHRLLQQQRPRQARQLGRRQGGVLLLAVEMGRDGEDLQQKESLIRDCDELQSKESARKVTQERCLGAVGQSRQPCCSTREGLALGAPTARRLTNEHVDQGRCTAPPARGTQHPPQLTAPVTRCASAPSASRTRCRSSSADSSSGVTMPSLHMRNGEGCLNYSALIQ